MFSRSMPLENDCDAPPYVIVKACQGLGFQTPLDVCWHRRSRYLVQSNDQGGLSQHLWNLFFGKRQPRSTCRCGHPLPLLERYTFTYRTEKKVEYLVGQCRGCRTIFWEEPVSPLW